MEALVKREIISWAIKRNNQDPVRVAHKLNIKPDTLNAWINGDSRPTFQQALLFAKKLNIPFGYLYLSTPPPENLPLPDLRTIAGTTSEKPSPNFLDVLYDALRKQTWYHDYLKEEGGSPVPFIAKFSLDSDPNSVAEDIRATLGINEDLRQECDTWEDFLRHFVYRAENVGVLVLRNGVVGCDTHRKLDLDEFRGFAISDELAPLVFINANDFKTAEIFTLAHELAHLWIGKSGVSNLDYKLRSKQQRHVIDQYCDRAAAEVLVPHDDFLMRWNFHAKVDDNLARLARYYRVSAFVVLRRAHEYDKITEDVFKSKYQELLTKVRPRKPDGGGDFYKLVLSRNSATLTKSLILATSGGRVLPTEAAKLLNIKYTRLSTVETYLLTGSTTSA